MQYGKYTWSYRMLRWGIGITYAWIGVDMFIHPETWIGYIPAEGIGGLDRDTSLMVAGVLDVGIGILLIIQKFVKAVSALASVHLAGILFTHGLDSVLIRDVGLLGATLALLTWPAPLYQRKNKRSMFSLPRIGLWPFKKKEF